MFFDSITNKNSTIQMLCQYKLVVFFIFVQIAHYNHSHKSAKIVIDSTCSLLGNVSPVGANYTFSFTMLGGDTLYAIDNFIILCKGEFKSIKIA